MGIGHLRGRNYLTLSGGEKQMIHFARSFPRFGKNRRTHIGTSSLTNRRALSTSIISTNFCKWRGTSLPTIRLWLPSYTMSISQHNSQTQWLCCRRAESSREGTVDEIMRPDVFEQLYHMKATAVQSKQMSFPMMVFESDLPLRS